MLWLTDVLLELCELSAYINDVKCPVVLSISVFLFISVGSAAVMVTGSSTG